MNEKNLKFEDTGRRTENSISVKLSHADRWSPSIVLPLVACVASRATRPVLTSIIRRAGGN
jgi:hypothetical protein